MAGVHGGGCLCGGVRSEVEGPLAAVQLCHCGQCRKAQGSAFGANLLREYRASTAKRRVFCGTCGSPLFSQRDGTPEVLRLRAGTLDGDCAGLEIGFHIQTASKAAWWSIDDGRPQHPHAAP